MHTSKSINIQQGKSSKSKAGFVSMTNREDILVSSSYFTSYGN